MNSKERHFFATWHGRTGFYVYTPLQLADGRYLFVNRGFVPYENKEPEMRMQGQLTDQQTVTGLARAKLPGKPSWVVPDNDRRQEHLLLEGPRCDGVQRRVSTRRKSFPSSSMRTIRPIRTGLPIGGVTDVDLPNNHLQYAFTWYGLAATLVVIVVVARFRKRGVTHRRNSIASILAYIGLESPICKPDTDMNIAAKPPLTIRLCGPRGFCAGVDRAIQIVVLALKSYGAPVYVRHEIVHNRYVVEGLEAKGAVFVEELDEIPKSTVPSRSSSPPMACRNPCLKMRAPVISSTSTPHVRWSRRSTSRRCATTASAAMSS